MIIDPIPKFLFPKVNDSSVVASSFRFILQFTTTETLSREAHKGAKCFFFLSAELAPSWLIQIKVVA